MVWQVSFDLAVSITFICVIKERNMMKIIYVSVYAAYMSAFLNHPLLLSLI